MARRKKTAPASSFPYFIRLPVEIQDEIWKNTLDIEAPSVHFTTIDDCLRASFLSASNTTYLDPVVWKLKVSKIYTRDDESRAKRIFPVRLALLLTCQNSRRAVERLSRNWAPTGAVSLEIGGRPLYPSCISPFTTPNRLREQRNPDGLQMTIDTSNDLAIFCNPWCTHLAASHPPFGGQPIFPEIKYVGIYYDPERIVSRSWSHGTHERELEAILRMFPDLRVLYLVIHPDNARKRIFDPLTEYMEGYYKACLKTREEVPSKTFKSCDRIYYEMAKKLPLGMCENLDNVIEKLWDISDQHEGPRLVVRVMTWKHAPGVRGRFDL